MRKYSESHNWYRCTALNTDHLTTVVKHFEDEWGISFRTLEPMNEPDTGWTVNGGQEGCAFSHSNALISIVSLQHR